MLSAFAQAFRTPDLRRKLLFTLFIMAMFRLGSYIPTPGVDSQAIQTCLAQQSEANLLDLVNLFSGGALLQLSIFALGIMPYITASIIIQLLRVVIPRFDDLHKEGQTGQAKLTQYTRYLTIFLGVLQATTTITLARTGRMFSGCNAKIIADESAIMFLIMVIVMMAGTGVVMWLGELVTERGIGNGMSLLIFTSIAARLPSQMIAIGQAGKWGSVLAILLLLLAVTLAVVYIEQAQRRIPVQYAKRVMGNKMFNGATQYLPLKLNYSGVMPVIFATAILSLPQVLFSQIAHYNTTLQWIATKMNDWLNPASSGYYIISGLMIFFFSYFWVATMFQPSQIAEDLKRNGGYIPGIRPGPPTALFLDQTMQRLTFAGSAFLTLIYFLPSLLNIGGNIPYLVTQFFGGTSLLILVGVLLDMMRQVETTLLSRNYDGFLKKGKLKGKYGHIQGTGAAAGSRTVTVMWIVIALLVLAGAIAYNAMQ